LHRSGGVACALLVANASAGCGEAVDRHDISGSVTFDGKPIVFGQIDFVPDRAANNAGPPGYAEIKDGKYNTADNGRGVVNGPHEVRITAYESQPPPAPEVADELAQAATEPPKPLFNGYTLKQDLSAATHDFSVPADAAGFDIFQPGGGTAGGANVP
jgi:hypothetical protein